MERTTPISRLDGLMMEWSQLQPDRCKLDPEASNHIKVVNFRRRSSSQPSVALSKVYRVYAPNAQNYFPIAADSMGADWKTVGVAEGFEEKDVIGMTHLIIAVIEALKNLRYCDRNAELPIIYAHQDAYPTALEFLAELIKLLKASPR